MTNDLIQVLIDVRPSDGVVSVRKLLDTPVGTALLDSEGYERIGQVIHGVEQAAQPGSAKRLGWHWFYDEDGYGNYSGFEVTKTRAINALLDEGGYTVAPPNATNQGLFS